MIRTNISSGYPFEDVYGYARAVRVGNQVFVSGTTARPPDLEGDAYRQMMGAIATVAAALGEAGAELRHVVRTVVYIIDMADAHHIARAHGETFGAVASGQHARTGRGPDARLGSRGNRGDGRHSRLISGRGFADQLDRRHRDLAAGDLPCPFRVVLEEIPRLQRLDGLLVGRRGEMKVA